MKQLVHGGDWMGYRERFGRDALDFSANVSPLGLPEGVAQAIRDALPLADRYPDPLCRTLRAALSRAEGVPQERILCGNGAADLIFRLVWAVKPHKALVTAPTFAEYASALDTVECEVNASSSMKRMISPRRTPSWTPWTRASTWCSSASRTIRRGSWPHPSW